MSGRDLSAGLCETCAHAREIRSAKGSRFLLCGLAATDPRFRRYPQIPVLDCRGFSEKAAADKQKSVANPARARTTASST